jgi:hypothetical protein
VTARSAARLAWSLCAASVAGIGGLLVLKVLNGPADLRSAPLAAAPLAFSVVGALVAARQHRNPVGWQLLAVGVFGTANLLGESYARYALITAPGSLPGGRYGVWLGWTYAPVVAILAILLPLYFPTGRRSRPAGDRFSGRGSASWSSRWLATPCCPDPMRRCWALLRCPTRWCTCPRPGRCSSCSSSWLCCARWSGSLGPSPRWWCGFDVPAGSNASS